MPDCLPRANFASQNQVAIGQIGHRLYTCTQFIGSLEALLDEMGKASQPQASW